VNATDRVRELVSPCYSPTWRVRAAALLVNCVVVDRICRIHTLRSLFHALMRAAKKGQAALMWAA
jgi:hypothetical protein